MEQQYVAIDLHSRRSLIVRQNAVGEELSAVRIDNDPVALSIAIAEAGPNPEVAIEATYGTTGLSTPSRRKGPTCTWCTQAAWRGMTGA